MAEDGGLGVMPAATALTSVSLIGGWFRLWGSAWPRAGFRVVWAWLYYVCDWPITGDIFAMVV